MPYFGPLEIVTHFNALWATGDIEGALALFAEDAVYELHISADVLPFGGQSVGRTAIGETMRRMHASWEHILYRPLALTAKGDTVRFQVEFMCRHLASGETLSGRSRIVMRVENALIRRVDEYHDGPKFQAFMRLVQELVKP